MKNSNRNSFSRALLLTAGAMMLSVGSASAADSELKVLLEQATESRTKLLADVEQKSAEAEALRQKQSYAEADALLQAQLKRLTPQRGEDLGTAIANRRSELQDEIKSLRREWSGAIMLRARQAASEKRYSDAMLIAAEAAVVDTARASEVKTFNEKCDKLNKAADYRKETNITVFEKNYSANQEAIGVLLREANTFYSNGRYEEARIRLERVFLLDPFNNEAINFLSRVYTQLYTAAQSRRNADISGMMAANAWGWSEPIFPTEMENVAARQSEVKSLSSESIYGRLDKIIIPEFTFTNFNIRKVVNKLNEMAKDADPDKRGVNISLGLDSDRAKNLDVSMNFLQIPLSDLLRYLCLETGLKYRVEGDGIIIGTSDADMQDQAFQVRGDLIVGITGGEEAAGGEGGMGGGAPAAAPAATTTTESTLGKLGEGKDFTADDAINTAAAKQASVTSAALKSYFEARGVSFKEGSSIAYDRRVNRIFVRNTVENLRRLDELLRQLDAIATPLVMVEIKMVEITENDWQELGFQWRFNMQDANNPGDGKNSPDSSKANSGWNMNQSTTWNPVGGSNPSENYLVNDLKVLPNFGNGLIKGVNMNLALSINALSRNDRTEVLSAPKLVTSGGSVASIKMTKQYYFPDSWEAPEIETSGDWTTIKLPTPEWSDPTDIGIILKVRPEVDPDNYTISLELHPEIVTFLGKTKENKVKIDIGTINPEDGKYKPSPGYPLWVDVWMPILGRRKADVFAKVYDGETIVIGGMIDNKTETTRDRWPILGDVPLLGRLFAGESEIKVKNNLMLFVTARLINNDGVPIRRGVERGAPDFNR